MPMNSGMPIRGRGSGPSASHFQFLIGVDQLLLSFPALIDVAAHHGEALRGRPEMTALAGRRDPDHRMRLLQRLRNQLARRDLVVLAVKRENVLAHRRFQQRQPFFHLRQRFVRIDVERPHRDGGVGAAAVEFHAAVGQDVGHGKPLGRTQGVVDALRHQRHRRAQLDARRHRSQIAEHHFGRRARDPAQCHVLLGERDAVEADLLGQTDFVDQFVKPARVTVADLGFLFRPEPKRKCHVSILLACEMAQGFIGVAIFSPESRVA